ncbi:MAG: DegT/DnrJ/EryC1/StrS family aminotransferase [Vicinamibacteria bacterium]|nr:DegT/DnrJ/EryC1/StrS family aminotransferase [Vicinamibacteria bacterium]
MVQPIPFCPPYFGDEEARAAADVVRSGWVVGGKQQLEFERRFAALCGKSEGIAVSNWTTGAFLVLHAWGIGPGDQVIVPSLTFIASVNVIRHAGATPVFADVDPVTLNLDPEDARRRITSKTRAIIPVDQLGMPCRIDEFVKIGAEHGLRVLQDAACAIGSRYRGAPVGALSELSVFSLHARKVVSTGEGGMIVTDDAAFATRLRRLRHQGMSISDFQRHSLSPTTFETYPEVGFNFRLTDIQAAIGNRQLDKLEEMLQKRKVVAARFNAELETHPWITPPTVPEHSEVNWQTYQARVKKDAPFTRNEAMERLHALGIPTRRGVMSSHLEPPYAGTGVGLPHTEDATNQGLQLPLHPALSDEEIERVCAALRGLR